MGHASGHGMHVRPEQRNDRHGWRSAESRDQPFRHRMSGPQRRWRDGHLRHVLFPDAVARPLAVHGVCRVLQRRRFRVLGQQFGRQLPSVRRRFAAGCVVIVISGAGVRRRAASIAAAAVRRRLRPPDVAAGGALLRRAIQTELVDRLAGSDHRHVCVLVNDDRVTARPPPAVRVTD